MLREISASIDEHRVRTVLFTIGALISAVLAPAAIVGMFFGISSILGGGPREDIEIGLVGFMASAGIAGAWVRLVLPSERFRESTRLRNVVAGSIAMGILASVIMIIESGADAFSVFLATVGLVGAYLLCATVGAKRDAI